MVLVVVGARLPAKRKKVLEATRLGKSPRTAVGSTRPERAGGRAALPNRHDGPWLRAWSPCGR
jgi:hypothetical protein